MQQLLLLVCVYILYDCICINQCNHLALFIIIETSTALYNGFQADSTDLAISLLSGNSTFVPSVGLCMHGHNIMYT